MAEQPATLAVSAQSKRDTLEIFIGHFLRQTEAESNSFYIRIAKKIYLLASGLGADANSQLHFANPIATMRHAC
jgi:hypothetical protein